MLNIHNPQALRTAVDCLHVNAIRETGRMATESRAAIPESLRRQAVNLRHQATYPVH